MADDEDEKEYRWETGYEKTWEVIQEDDQGLLESSIKDIIHKAKRKRLLEKTGSTRLGMMRHLFLVIDLSDSMNDHDLKPSRQLVVLKMLEGFLDEFFDQNPISQLGLITTYDKRAERAVELSGNPKHLTDALRKLQEHACCGEPSLQNSLEMAASLLKNMPSHASREVIIICGSLTTCDPGDIYTTIKTLKSLNIRCSVIGLSAELRVCKVLCRDTEGSYDVILDERHFKDVLFRHVDPPPAIPGTESALIKMGFPQHLSTPAMCMCHLDEKEGKFDNMGYYCPRCGSKYCELPVECRVCGLTLVSAPHLARSYHHLFPLKPFTETNNEHKGHPCFACQKECSDNLVYTCDECNKIFCLECDLFIHETLHTCPGCTENPSKIIRGLQS